VTPQQPHLAILVSFSGRGGVEHMISRIAPAIAERGIRVDLLSIKQRPPYFEPACRGVNLVPMPFDHTRANLPALVRYLRSQRPAALLAAKDRAIRTAALARRIAGVPTRVVGRLGTNLSESLSGKPAAQRWMRTRTMRIAYARVDQVIAISEGVAADTRALTALPVERVSVVYNPAIPPDIAERAAGPSGHPWLDDKCLPVIVGAGRLTAQKDFPTLIRAFARLRHERECRLVIFGDGRERDALLGLAKELGVADDLSLPGHTDRLFSALARADIFALSSRWEGLGNVLIEALAVGTPVVSTDCPSGPREILLDGRVGPLVPVGDDAALAVALQTTLASPPAPDTWQASLSRFTLDNAVTDYLRILGLRG